MKGSLRERKIEALQCMLNFNGTTNVDNPQWKILIYDRIGQDIIAPLFTVKQLRALGVTLHLLLDVKRDPIPDVPAIYFVYPSRENIKRICNDFEEDLYEFYYLNFISPISRENLELLAENAFTEDCVKRIKKVFDQYARFVCLEEDLFVLNDLSTNENETFFALNRTTCSENDIQLKTNSIVDSLYSVFATLGTVPIIRCSRFNAAEVVSKELDAKFRESLRDSRNTLFTSIEYRNLSNTNFSQVPSSNLFQRPLLIILDRALDLATPLHHAWTYQSLLHDLVGIRLNHVDISPQQSKETENVPNKGNKCKRYDLSSVSDRLWNTHRNSPFSDVAGALQEELSVLQDREKKLSVLKASVGGNFDNGTELPIEMNDTTSALTNTINTLPQLLEQKRCLDMHMTIATYLAKDINARQLDLLNDVEEKLLARQTLTEHSISSLINTPTFTAEDKLRLLLLVALSSCGTSSGSGGGNSSTSVSNSSSTSTFCLSTNELKDLSKQLSDLHPNLDTSAMRYVLHLRHVAKLSNSNSFGVDANKGSTGRDMFNKLVSHGSAIFREGMRSIVGRKSYFPSTQIISQLVENKTDSDEYGYYDPKIYRRNETNMPRSKQPFFDVYVFIVGGGTYAEYHNLLDWSNYSSWLPGSSGSSASLSALGLTLSSSGSQIMDTNPSLSGVGVSSRRITYGATEIVTPNGFLEQLTKLGKEL